MLYFVAGIAVGILLGRLYARAKYHYPEFQEMIRLRVARLRAERAKREEEEERTRAKFDRSLERRTGR